MKKGINKVILVGHLGKDPEIKHASNGDSITIINLATGDTWKDKNTGQTTTKTEWHRVVLFGKLAEIAGQYLTKGSQAYFEGKLQTSKWKDQTNQDRYTTEVVIDRFDGVMQMLGGNNNSKEYSRDSVEEIKNNNRPKGVDNTLINREITPMSFNDELDDKIPF